MSDTKSDRLLFRDMPALRSKKRAGLLEEGDVLVAMESAVRAARDLLEDARILYSVHRWSRAAALGILSLEECGKVMLLGRLAGCQDDEVAASLWRDYYSHPIKIAQNIRTDEMRDANENELRRANLRVGGEFDTLKQLAFYSCQTEAGWTTPDDAVTQKQAFTVLQLAIGMVEQLKGWEEHVRDIGTP